MRAEALLPSNQSQAASTDQSKRVPHIKDNAGLYARCRRLEQRLERIEAALTTVRRDVWRIEKSKQRAEALSKNNMRLSVDEGPQPTMSALFGGS